MTNVHNIATGEPMPQEVARHEYEVLWETALAAIDALAYAAMNTDFAERGYQEKRISPRGQLEYVTISGQSMLRTIDRNLNVVRERLKPVTTSQERGGAAYSTYQSAQGGSPAAGGKKIYSQEKL